jgi:hypothetical protein
MTTAMPQGWRIFGHRRLHIRSPDGHPQARAAIERQEHASSSSKMMIVTRLQHDQLMSEPGPSRRKYSDLGDALQLKGPSFDVRTTERVGTPTGDDLSSGFLRRS